MSAPQLISVVPVGSTRVRVLFDQPMRSLPGTPADPSFPGNWTVAGGAVASVASTAQRREYTLVLDEPLTLAPHLVTAALTLESMAGEAMDSGAHSLTVTPTEADLAVVGVAYPDRLTLVVSFNLALASAEVTQDRLQVTGSVVDGTDVTVTFDEAGQAGKRFLLEMSPVAGGVNQTGSFSVPFFGQGLRPHVADVVATSTSSLLVLLSEEPVGPTVGLGAVALSQGSLGSSVAQDGAQLTYEAAALVPTTSTSFSLARTTRTVLAGTDFSSQAAEFSGAATETTGVGTTTINKTSGSPYTLVFSGGTDSLTRAGREWATAIKATFTPDDEEFPLLGVPWLNTGVMLVLYAQPDGTCVLSVNRGLQKVPGAQSFPLDFTSAPVVVSVVDATAEQGTFAVLAGGQVVCGAPASALEGGENTAYTATTFALSVGDPLDTTRTFSLEFSANVEAQSFFTTGLLGKDTRDLFSFASRTFTAPAAPSPENPGFQDTGVGAFGVVATYYPQHDAVGVVVGLNAAVGKFTGTVSLLTSAKAVMDQVLVDYTHRLVGEPEVVVYFMRPKGWAGMLVGVTLTIDDADYSAVVPVGVDGGLDTIAPFVQQRGSWQYPRLSIQQAFSTDDFGPSAAYLTPP